MHDHNAEAGQKEPARSERVSELDSAPEPGILQCPQCGGTHIRRRIRPLLFNLGVCVVFWGLAQVPGLRASVSTGAPETGRRV